MTNPSLNINIKASDADAHRALGRLQKDVEKVGGATEKAGKSGLRLSDAFAGIAIGAGLKYASDQASELEQAIGATATIFGEAGTVVDEWAAKSVDAFGLSERAFREATAPLGSILQAMGQTQEEAAETSVQLTQLGADFAAAFGGTTQDAIAAVSAAFRGEFDPIERYGVKLSAAKIEQEALNSGLAESKDQIDDRIKSEAALNLILEQSTNVQGQWNRELDTTASKQQRAAAEAENAAASLGESLTPITAKASEVIAGLAEAFQRLPQPAQTAALAGAMALLVGPRVVEGASLAKDGLTRLGSTLADLPVKAAGAHSSMVKLTSAMLSSPAAMSGVGLAAGVLAVGFYELVLAQDKAAEAAGELVSAMEASGDTLDEVFTDRLAKTIADLEGGFDLGGSGDTFGRELERVGLSVSELSDLLSGSKDDFDEYVNNLDYSDGRTVILAEDLRVLRGAYSGAEEKAKKFDEVQEELGAGTDDVAASTREATAATEDATAAEEERVEALEAAADELKRINDETERQIDLATGRVTAGNDYEDAQRATQAAADKVKWLKAAGASSEEVAEAERELEEAILKQAEAADTLTRTEAELSGAHYDAATSAAVQRSELQRVQRELGFTSEDLDAVIWRLAQAERDHKIKMDRSEVLKAIEALKVLDSILHPSVVNPYVHGGAAVSGDGSDPFKNRAAVADGLVGNAAPTRGSGAAVVIEHVSVDSMRGLTELDRALTNRSARDAREVMAGV